MSYGGIVFGLDRSSDPYIVGLNSNGVWYRFGQITAAGVVVVNASDITSGTLNIDRVPDAVQRISDIATLRGVAPSSNRSIDLLGYYSAGDGGGGDFRGATGAAPGTYEDNGGSIIVPTGGNGSAAWLIILDIPLTAKQCGAVGDGVTDDTAAFVRIESQSQAPTVDLLGSTYKIASIWADAVNGALLTKDYKNGVLSVDGRKLVFDGEFGRSASAASRARLPVVASRKQLGLYKVDANTYYVYRHIIGRIWTRMRLSRAGSGIPFNWDETYFKQVLAFKAARESGVVYTGAWAVDDVTTALKSTDNTYVSGRAQQATGAGDYVEVTFTGGGDIYVIYVGRTNANYVNVLLDGAQSYITLPDDGSGNRYFDSYTSPDLQFKQIVQIASGVPNGEHTIRLTVSATKNGSSTGNRFVFNSLAWSSDDTGPWTPDADAPVWVTSEAVLQNQRRKYGTNYYRADGDGTTGATPPTHTSGSVSDGTVSWTYVSTSSYELLDHRIHAAGSQLEYAYEIKPTGASAYNDVGGALHANEVQSSFQWYLSGNQVTPPTASWLVGDDVAIVEDLYATHSEIGGGSSSVNSTTLTRRFSKSGVSIRHEHVLQTAGVFGYFYAHMWPLLHYSSEGAKFGIESIWSPSDGERLCTDWYGLNRFVGRTKDTLMIARGGCLQPDGAAGVPTTTEAPLQFVAWLDVDPSSVDYYKTAKTLFASKAMNTSAASAPPRPFAAWASTTAVDVDDILYNSSGQFYRVTVAGTTGGAAPSHTSGSAANGSATLLWVSSGYSSLTSKIYFERHSQSDPAAYSSGDKIVCSAFYGIALEAA